LGLDKQPQIIDTKGILIDKGYLMYYTNAQRNEAKQNFLEFLSGKTANWKADTQIYINNQINLVKDDVNDIVRGKLKRVKFDNSKGSLCKLTTHGDLPFDKYVYYDALVAVAGDMGVLLGYKIRWFESCAVVKFFVIAPDKFYHVSEPMKYTSVNPANNKDKVLEVIESVEPDAETEDFKSEL
jgi:hypothetical protein